MGKLGVFAGREKKVPFSWKQGSASNSPPINTTGATCILARHSLKASPTITLVDALTGSYELLFPAEATRGLTPGNSQSIYVALTFTADPGSSPDPIRVEVAIQ